MISIKALAPLLLAASFLPAHAQQAPVGSTTDKQATVTGQVKKPVLVIGNPNTAGSGHGQGVTVGKPKPAKPIQRVVECKDAMGRDSNSAKDCRPTGIKAPAPKSETPISLPPTAPATK